MPTPPRTLPSSSPSSARLRRIAPSPVKIPLPPGRESPRRVQSRLTSQHVHLAMLSGANGVEELPKPSEVVMGYDFIPLEPGLGEEGWLTPSPIGAKGQQPLFAVPELQLHVQFKMDNPRKDGYGCASASGSESGWMMPLILDRRGEFGRIASDWRMGVKGLDVPDCVEYPTTASHSNTKEDKEGEELQVLGLATNLSKRRSGPTTLSPKRYMDKHVPLPILVNFRTDVFSVKGREEIRQEERRTREESTPRITGTRTSTTLKLFGTAEDMVRKEEERSISIAESWKTFGPIIAQSERGSPESTRTIRITNGNKGVDVNEETRYVSDNDDDKARGNDQSYKSDQDIVEDEDGDGDHDGWSFMLSAYQDQDRDYVARKGSFSSTSAYSENDIDIRDRDRSRTPSFGHTIDGDGLGLKITHEHDPLTTDTDTDKRIIINKSENTPLGARLLVSRFVPPAQAQEVDSPASEIILTPLHPDFLDPTSNSSLGPKLSVDGMVHASTSTSATTTTNTKVDLQIKRWPQTQSQLHLLDDRGHAHGQWNDSPTPKPKLQSRPLLLPLPLSNPNSDSDASADQDKSGYQSQRQNRRSRAPTLDKALPQIPIIVRPTQESRALNSAQSDHNPNNRPIVDLSGSELDPVEMALRDIDKSITVQLWVDQEGTRAHRTSFKYLRSIKAATFRERELNSLQEAAAWCESPTRPEMFQQTGAWVFGLPPRERDKWNFHSAALEGLPVLRRLTINNDEKHDYLSRGATLQIKEPGVYAVHGVDDRRGAGAGRVEWKFEYLVQPRVSMTTGEEINGEKLVVPLALYVTPTFFNPERGQKTHLLNMFKKTLAPNIVSEKIRPPHVGKPPQKPIMESTLAPPAMTAGPPASTRSEERDPQSTVAPASAAPAPAPTAIGKFNDADALRVGVSGKPGKHARHRSDITQAHLHSLDMATPTSHARSVSRTINAFAKAVTGLGSSTPTHTPTQSTNTHDDSPSAATPLGGSGAGNTTPGNGTHVHKFGSKSPGFATLRSGRSRTATASSILTNTNSNSNTQDLLVSEEKDKREKEKGKTRNRAASLFSRSRPFTPPVNITTTHPVPALAVSPTPTPGHAHLPSTNIRIGSANSRHSTMAPRLPLPLQSYKGVKGRPTTSPSPSPGNSRGPSPSQPPLNHHPIHTQAALGQTTSHLHPFYQHVSPYQQAHPLNPGITSTPSLSRSASTSTSSRYPRIVTPTPSPTRPFVHGYSRAVGVRIEYDQRERERAEIAPAGLTPAPRKRPAMRKRPSTAEPRLGM